MIGHTCDCFNSFIVINIRGSLNTNLLKETLAAVINSHEIFKVYFKDVSRQKAPLQIINESVLYQYREEYLSAGQDIGTYLHNERTYRFDADGEQPVVRVMLYHLPADAYLL